MNEWLWTVVIVAIVLLLFGAKRIPDVMKSFGQGIKEFKKAAKEIESDVASEPQPRRPEQRADVDNSSSAKLN